MINMSIFALVNQETSIVENCIVADTYEEVQLLYSDFTIIEMNDFNSPGYIGGLYDGYKFYPPSPGPGYEWNGITERWEYPEQPIKLVDPFGGGNI